MRHSVNNRLRLILALLVGICSTLLSAPFEPSISAHGGGTPQLTSVPVGPYRLYAWSEPEPWRVGQVHLSLAVTKPNPDTSSNQVELPVTDVEVQVTYTPMLNGEVDPSFAPVVVDAEQLDFLGTFYFEADPVLTRVGDWQIFIEVSGPEGTGSKEFAMTTLPERTLNWTLIAGAGLLLVVILALMAFWSRSQQPAQPAQRRPGTRRTHAQAAEHKEA